jgi:RNA polymerase sigma-70 factor (ECF subfamily)
MASIESSIERPAHDPEAEALLLAKVVARDREAFRRLYCLYHRRLHRFLSRFACERGTAEEIINDTMLVVWQSAAEFRGDAKASTWILGIAYRRALKALERHRQIGPRTQRLAAAAIFQPQLLDHLSRSAELGNWLETALRHLSAEHRLVIELAYYFGLSIAEVAAVTGSPEGTVKTRMFYGRERLRVILLELAGGGAVPETGP